jgi:hypothetical protein
MKNAFIFFSILTLCVILLGVLGGCETDSKAFVRIAKTAFEKSVRNDASAAELIDWNSIQINGEELGRSFMELSTDYEKSHFKSAVIERMSQFYASRDWNVTNVRNWKLQSKGVESAIVTAEAPGGTITISFQKVDFEKKITRIMNE